MGIESKELLSYFFRCCETKSDSSCHRREEESGGNVSEAIHEPDLFLSHWY